MGRIRLLFALIIGVILNLEGAAAQRTQKTTVGAGRSTNLAKPARTHTTSAKSSTKPSRASSNAAAASMQIPDVGSKAALEAMEIERVTRLENERIQADLKKDKNWFADNFADDITSANSEGILENKAQLIARCLDPANQLVSETYDELTVRAYGDVMIVIGKLSQKGRSNDAPYDFQRRFTDVWVNRAGRWQQVAMHTSPIRAGAAPDQSAAVSATQPQSTNSLAPSPAGRQSRPTPNPATPSPSPTP
jgi:ketosteroid isomerase-like protein